MKCDNYHVISIFSVPGKMLFLILLERLKTIVEPQLLEAQCGFREGQGMYNGPNLGSQALIEKPLEHGSELCPCFIDLSKAYHSGKLSPSLYTLW